MELLSRWTYVKEVGFVVAVESEPGEWEALYC